jgi:cytochrome c1
MKRGLLSLLFLTSVVFAQSGENVYKQYCASCHTKDMMMDMNSMMEQQKKMQTATNEERQAMREKMMIKMNDKDMKAPAMPMISMRIKHMTESKEEFMDFVKDYIQSPSIEKGFCMPRAYERFGVMPPIGKGMSESERNMIAQWLYESFNGSWSESMGGKMCKKNNRNMNANSMKCGGTNKGSMRCGSGKCGSN